MWELPNLRLAIVIGVLRISQLFGIEYIWNDSYIYISSFVFDKGHAMQIIIANTINGNTSILLLKVLAMLTYIKLDRYGSDKDISITVSL